MPRTKTSIAHSSVKTDALKPYTANARTHPKAQIRKLVKSIRAYGFINPLLVDERNEIIAGHGRLIAAKEVGLKELPVIRVSGLSETAIRALRLADNQIATESGWDMELVRLELAAITIDTEFDIELTGFDIERVDVILDEDCSDPVQEDVPAVPRKPVSRSGDIWIAGNHRIGCGDVKDAKFLKQVVGPKKVAAAFLDPPYNVKIDGHVCGKGKVKHREFAEASGEMTSSAFISFLTETLTACAKVSASGAVHFVCMDHRHADELIIAGGQTYGERLNICVWNKSNAGMGSLYRSKHELVFVYRVGKGKHRNNIQLGKHGRNRTNVWDYPSVNSFKGSRSHDLALHPTVKPVGMVADAILDVTKRGETVLDAFLGSGTSLIAAERTGRTFVGLDIDPAYVDVAILRWRDVTGLEPVRESDGLTYTAAKTASTRRKEA